MLDSCPLSWLSPEVFLDVWIERRGRGEGDIENVWLILLKRGDETGWIATARSCSPGVLLSIWDERMGMDERRLLVMLQGCRRTRDSRPAGWRRRDWSRGLGEEIRGSVSPPAAGGRIAT